MQKKSRLRFVSAMLSVTMLAGSVYFNEGMWQEMPVYAWTSSELEAQKNANDAEIAQMQAALEELGSSKSSQEEYQQTLTEKLELQQKNVQIVDEQLTRIEEEIVDTQADITQTEADIVVMQADISVGLEEFKQRVRAMYINGNDSLASALVGATDFFDFLSKYNLISRVAKHDNELINDLKGQVTACNEKKDHLVTEKEALDVQLSEQEDAKEELKNSILQLQEDYEDSEEHLQMLADKQALLNDDIAALEAANLELKEEDDRILAAILAAEEKRRQEEEAAKLTATTPAPYRPVTTYTTTKTPQNNPSPVYTTTKPAQIETPVYTTTTVAAWTQPPQTTAPPVYTTTTTTTTQPTYSNTRFAWPCPGFYVLTSGFGPRWGRQHSGIDIASAGIAGAAAVSSLSGTVIYATNGCPHNYAKSYSCGCGGGYGNYVIVQHDNGYSTVYAHLTSTAVSVGQYVSQGQVVGYVGSTGFSTGAHLHYEVRQYGTRVDPELYLY